MSPRLVGPLTLLVACGGGGESHTGGGDAEGAIDDVGSILLERVKEPAPAWHTDNLERKTGEGDDWRGEALFTLAKPALDTFLHELLHGDGEHAALLDTAFTGTSALRPAELETVLASGSAVVLRGDPGEERHPAGELGRLRDELLAPYSSAEPVHHFAKIIRVDLPEDDLLETVAILHLSGATASGRLQQNLELTNTWSVQPGDSEVLMRSLEAHSFEEVSFARPLFVDLSQEVFGKVPRYREEFLWGIPEHRYRTDILNGRHLTGMQGFSVGDVDGDGLDDLFVAQHGGLPNRLLLHRPNGTVEDASEVSGLASRDATRSTLIVDIDNDGDQDVVLSINTTVVVAYNDGRGRFDRSVPLRLDGTADVYSMCAADPDQDGDLDLYACRWSYNKSRFSTDDPPLPYHDANNGAPNYYWRQEEDGSFTEATAEVGLDDGNSRFSYAAIWDDLDQDGDLDLYVANDFGRNNLYVNEDGRFHDAAGARNAEDKSSGMGVTSGDYDLDGDTDLYVSNMFSSAGQRIVPQYEARDKGDLLAAHFQFASGNTLLSNNGDGTFEDVTKAAGVSVGGWAWGALFLDLNNDAYPDLYSPNGYITNEDTVDL
jgi:hypothetical protein